MKSKKRLLTVLIFVAIVLTVGALSGCSLFDRFINTKINLEFNSEIVLEETFYQYTGEAVTPQITLMHRDEVVSSDCYTVTYSNNTDPGEATVTATGKDNYYGSISTTFNISYFYAFDANGADEVDGELIQKVFSKEDLQLPEVNKLGYTFSHWSCDSQEVDFSDLDALPDAAEFVANYTLNVYTIRYVLDGGQNSPNNKSTYTVENTFDLSNPTLSGKRFGGWFTDANFQNRIESVDGYYENLTLYAKFGEYTDRTIYYDVPDGAAHVPYDLLTPETPLTAPAEQFITLDGMEKRLVWYADSTYYVKYVFREMPDEDIIVYARWEDVVPAGFLDKIDRFSASSVTLYSYIDLVDYIDYVCFSNVTTDLSRQNWVTLDYEFNEDIASQIRRALEEDCTYPRMTTATYDMQGNRFKIRLATDVTAREASLSATDENDLVPQLVNIFALQSSGRGSDYDKFPIDYVEKTYQVTTSNQLFYVLSHGYRPLPTAGSKAESIYNAFREIMRGICDDGMSDLEKVRAIYEWIILNVQYDYDVVEMNVSNDISYLYDAFYLEGALRGVAVCDGISKAFCVMCAIERIDCLRIAGASIDSSVGHAWNKVQIFGEWFVTDATWGNAGRKTTDEYISYEYLLFSDAERTEFTQQNYTNFVAKTKFDLSDYFSYREVQVGSYTADLYIDSVEELSYIFEYIELNFNLNEISGMSFEVILDGELVERINAEIAGKEDTLANKLYQEAKSVYTGRYTSIFNQPKFSVKSARSYGSNDTYHLIYIF